MLTLPPPIVLPVLTALEAIVIPIVLTLEITMQPAVLPPRHVVIVVGIGVLMLQPVVRPVMLSFQPVVLAIMTVGIAGVMCRNRCCQCGGSDCERGREKKLTHLTLLSSRHRKLTQFR